MSDNHPPNPSEGSDQPTPDRHRPEPDDAETGGPASQPPSSGEGTESPGPMPADGQAPDVGTESPGPPPADDRPPTPGSESPGYLPRDPGPPAEGVASPGPEEEPTEPGREDAATHVPPGLHRAEHAPGGGVAGQNGLAISSLVVGIIGLMFALFPPTFWLGLILGVVGLPLGLSGWGRARRGQAGGSAMAVAGAVLSGCAIVIGLFWLLVVVGVLGAMAGG